jgi:8-oxo-dGTP diphosphatase
MQVTVSVSALVVRDGHIILVRKGDGNQAIYTFPVGRQEPGETLFEAARREVWEETGQFVQVGELLWVRDYIGKRHEHAATDPDIHILDHLFRCSLADGGRPLHPAAPDPDQTGVEWVPVDRLPSYRNFYPQSLIPVIVEAARGAQRSTPVYVGDAN